jgi:hypothetical protein
MDMLTSIYFESPETVECIERVIAPEGFMGLASGDEVWTKLLSPLAMALFKRFLRQC